MQQQQIDTAASKCDNLESLVPGDVICYPNMIRSIFGPLTLAHTYNCFLPDDKLTQTRTTSARRHTTLI